MKIVTFSGMYTFGLLSDQWNVGIRAAGTYLKQNKNFDYLNTATRKQQESL